MKNTLKAIAIAVSLATTMGASAASIEAVPGLNTGQPFYSPEVFVQQENIPVIDLQGIDAKNHGKAIMDVASDKIELFIKNARRKFEVIGLDSKVLAQELTVTYNNSKALNPEFIGTLESIAQEVDMDPKELFALGQTDYAVVQLLKKGGETDVKNGGCTSMAFNDTGIVGQTNDLASLDGGALIVLKKEDSIVAMTGFAPAGQTLGKNVGVVINFIGHDTEGVDKQSTLATDMGALVDAVAKTENVEAALKLVEEHRTIVGINLTIADKYGAAASVEMSHDGLLIKRGENGVAHANHSLREGGEEAMRKQLGQTLVEQNKNGAFSFWRQEAADTFLKHNPESSVDAMKYIFSQKPIAQTAAYGSDFITVNTVVLDTVEGCMDMAAGVSEWNEYQKICF
ncbi:C45 family autoproteolytic acyltransferase/hydolase [Vibrio superstes]|uniref:Peptidase C45 hydrolase domain-containing protein n=1 Tax=Vibrio superstes NBRC 103154 TaxID=1219062 RepID=A0A511QMQ4_9VIBR|nr:C45 family peptidase [Vibrio superstes]GEM78608.1 hypothetical protein VSU01S_08530 [Vibrio superstes NBRC 103154]